MKTVINTLQLLTSIRLGPIMLFSGWFKIKWLILIIEWTKKQKKSHAIRTYLCLPNLTACIVCVVLQRPTIRRLNLPLSMVAPPLVGAPLRPPEGGPTCRLGLHGLRRQGPISWRQPQTLSPWSNSNSLRRIRWLENACATAPELHHCLPGVWIRRLRRTMRRMMRMLESGVTKNRG